MKSNQSNRQGITWLYCSEVFSLDIRMLCVAITTADQWLWSFIVSRTTPYMITSLGYGTYMFFGALMILMGVWAFFFVPETKGKFCFPRSLVSTAVRVYYPQPLSPSSLSLWLTQAPRARSHAGRYGSTLHEEHAYHGLDRFARTQERQGCLGGYFARRCLRDWVGGEGDSVRVRGYCGSQVSGKMRWRKDMRCPVLRG